MDAFARLKAEAAAKRDTAISNARLEYQQSLLKIKQLRNRLGLERTIIDAKPRIIIDLIQETMPRDRAFSLAECVAILSLTDKGRIFFPATVRTMLHLLVRRGILRPQRRVKGIARYIATEAAGPPTEFCGKTLPEVAEILIRERGPMNALELTILMQSRGYRAEDDPKSVRDSLLCGMRKHSERFAVVDGGRWALIGNL